jgi:predicted sulfurtransferase
MEQRQRQQEAAAVLFYHYFTSDQDRWWKDPKKSVHHLYEFQIQLCEQFGLKGRILIAEEGINGTVSGNRGAVEGYIQRMRHYKPYCDGENDDQRSDATGGVNSDDRLVFHNVDWKLSLLRADERLKENGDNELFSLFPDLKISVVKEIVSTGGLVDVRDLPQETGKHLTPQEFHEILLLDKDHHDIALIDCRNTFEHHIGHFVHPQTGEKATDPQMTNFSSFDKFCQENAEELKNRKVLMYCTGLYKTTFYIMTCPFQWLPLMIMFFCVLSLNLP